MVDGSFRHAAACVLYYLSFLSYSFTSNAYSAFSSSFKSEYFVTPCCVVVVVVWLRLCTASSADSTSPGIGCVGSDSTGWLPSFVSGSMYFYRPYSFAELLICCFQASYCRGSRKVFDDSAIVTARGRFVWNQLFVELTES